MAWLSFMFPWLVLIFGLYVIAKSAQFVVSATTRIAGYLHISQFVAGFMILGITTATPEMFISILAAFSGTPELSLGTLLGGNIMLLTLLAGIAAIACNGVKIQAELSNTGRVLQIGLLILIPLLLLADGHLSHLDSLYMAILYIGYLIYVYRLRPKESPPIGQNFFNYKILHTIFLLVAGFLGLVLAAKAVVSSATQIADMVHIPKVVVGTLLLALGTNIPELSVVIAAMKRRQTNLIIGDVLGSASTHTLIIAMVAAIKPFTLEEWEPFQITAIFLMLAAVTFFVLTRTGKVLTKTEGVILVAVYVGFVTSQLLGLYF